jgi:PAS domain S-box-containing protein
MPKTIANGRHERTAPVLRSQPLFVLAVTLLSVLVIDALLTLFLWAVGPLPSGAELLLEVLLLAAILAPVLYFIVFRPMRMQLVEQARSEARFNDVAENAEEWIWEVDTNGLYTYASPIVERVLGYAPEEVVGKRHFYDFFHPDDREALKKAALEVFERGERFREFPNRNVHRDGQEVLIHTSGVPIVDESGNLVGYRGTDADVTQRLQAEQERERMAKELQRSLAEEIQILRGIIPICASCKRIRDDAGYWQQVEVYIRDRTEAEFSHGMCPECSRAVEEELERS